MRSSTRTWLTVIFLIALAGCNSALETGYVPRLLGASDAVRRAYYAPPFTPEAHAAQVERQQEFEQRRPSPNY